jgi:hypothetical protein
MVINMWALIQNGTVAEITDIDPQGRFHPSLVWVGCGPDVKAGDVYENGEFSKPEPQEPESQQLVEAHHYLNSTDFYYARFLETGEAVPEDVVTKRKAARDFIRANTPE